MALLHWRSLARQWKDVLWVPLLLGAVGGSLAYGAFLAVLFVAGSTVLDFPEVQSPGGSWDVQLSNDVYCPPGREVGVRVLGVRAGSVQRPDWVAAREFSSYWVPRTGVGTALGHDETSVRLTISASVPVGTTGTVSLVTADLSRNLKDLRIIAADGPTWTRTWQWLAVVSVTAVCALLWVLFRVLIADDWHLTGAERAHRRLAARQ
jgi:hypothetical protein